MKATLLSMMFAGLSAVGAASARGDDVVQTTPFPTATYLSTDVSSVPVTEVRRYGYYSGYRGNYYAPYRSYYYRPYSYGYTYPSYQGYYPYGSYYRGPAYRYGPSYFNYGPRRPYGVWY